MERKNEIKLRRQRERNLSKEKGGFLRISRECV